MKRLLCYLGLGFLAAAPGCSTSSSSLQVVDQVDLNRYLGKWYEIARYPNRFERNCVGATAEYQLRPDGKIQVLNTCHRGGLDGPLDSIKGTARVADAATQAKLKVTFFWPFSGDYWVIDRRAAAQVPLDSRPHAVARCCDARCDSGASAGERIRSRQAGEPAATPGGSIVNQHALKMVLIRDSHLFELGTVTYLSRLPPRITICCVSRWPQGGGRLTSSW